MGYNKSLCLMLVCLLAPIAISAEEGFVYLGSLVQPGGASRSFNKHDYYLSLQQETWNEARKQCHNLLGHSGSGKLVELEYESEWKGLEEFMQYEAVAMEGEQFWTGGYYDNYYWRWMTTGRLMDYSYLVSPWASGYPVRSLVQGSVIEHGRFNSRWATDSNSMSKRFICELQ